ncbi:acetoacetate--CoA ligase, partial [Mesorhizobium sp. M7A.T.Ca.TU.009.01.3.2]
MSSVLWTPAPAAFQFSNLARFATANGFSPHDYETMHRWSISDLGAFWRAVWDFAGVTGDPGTRSFLRDDQAPMTRSQFFPDASLNLAENLSRGDDDRVAVIEADESGHFRTVTLCELRGRVARIAHGLRAAGVARGDSVGGILPNRVEGLVALLATLSVGAVWSSCSPDFGAAAIVDRLGQIGVKVLFAT